LATLRKELLMHVIVFSKRSGARQFDLFSPACAVILALGVLALVGGSFLAGSVLGARLAESRPIEQMRAWATELGRERHQLDATRRTVQDKVDALAIRVGQMNAHVIRLDALGRRLTSMAKLDKGEFDFNREPPQGGADALDGNDQAADLPSLTGMLDRLSGELATRERQLGALEAVILTRDLDHSVYPQGRPVEEGFISSFYGHRVDPFTGRVSFHPGVDFAGLEGAKVLAVGTGVVTWSGPHAGYGNLVEIDHGNGYVTRYGHNETTLVAVGATVTKGQPLALLGSTGRSTGPHVHFEVLRDGNAVDPRTFINQLAAAPLAAH
jgi:murein DD-endopeptidase MepM/ murein hydrolase activator NlpD